MKKIYFLFSFAFIYNVVNAQIPNASFESWNTLQYNDPSGWECGNRESMTNLGVSPISKVAGVSGFAVCISTMNVSGQFTDSYITNGDPFNGEGGVPCGPAPTAITGSYRCNIMSGDTAFLLCVFKSGGSIIGMNMFHFTGNHTSFSTFSFPVSVGGAADTVIIAATSSNLISNTGVQAGSWLSLDNISLTNSGIAIPNADFENWTPFTIDIVNGWETYGDVSKTTDSYTGPTAIKLTTMDYGNGNIGSAGITSGQQTQNGTTGGQPFINMIDTLTGYYKYIPSGPDTASMWVSLSNNGNMIGGGGTSFPSANVYTYFEIRISAMSTPDTFRIDATSSKWPTSPSAIGSTLYLDDLKLKSQGVTGIFTNKFNANSETYIYPNPAGNSADLRLAQRLKGLVKLVIYDVSGRKVAEEYFNNTGLQIPVNLSALNPGMYYTELSNGSTRIQNKFIKK